MLVFVDESGDPGFKPGASRFFTVAVVLFEEENEATACDQRITLLRRELGLPATFEFHFSTNSRRHRLAFLEAVRLYGFFYNSVVLNKNPKQLWGEGFQIPESLYKYTCGLVFENLKSSLVNATVVLDRSGSRSFRHRLARYLRHRGASQEHRWIKKVRMQPSHSNNMLQLADYVAGVVNRKVQGKPDWKEYYEFLAVKELRVQVWPPTL